MRDTFKPEFLNRIDDTIIFTNLTKTDMGEIAEKFLAGLNETLKDRHLTLRLSKAAKDKLIELGFDHDFGARPLKRVFQRKVQNPLASQLLEGKFKASTPIEVSTKGDDFVFQQKL